MPGTSSPTSDAGSGSAEGLFETDLSLPGLRRGKVRDVYDLPPDALGPRLLIVASDRLSAFDVVMPTPIPGKGRLLTEVAAWWLRSVERAGLGPTHLLSTDAGLIPPDAYTRDGRPTRTRPEDLIGRVMIARACRVVPIECVVRGYLEGSGWGDYQRTGAVCGVPLPPGLRQCDRLPEPIFTPATKEEKGRHDENISLDRAATLVGDDLAHELRRRSLAIYAMASDVARARGIIIADTKFEFGFPLDAQGRPGRELTLVDEALTPDSSRFWPADAYAPGRAQASFDKQFVREHLMGLVERGRWDKQAPGPALPAEVVSGTQARYRRARDLLLGA